MEEGEPKIATPPSHAELTPPPEHVPDDKDDETEKFFKGAASEEEVAHADGAAAKRILAQQQKRSTFLGALWGFLKALLRFLLEALVSLSMIVVAITLIASMCLAIIASPSGKLVFKDTGLHELAKDLSDVILDFRRIMTGVPRIPVSERARDRLSDLRTWTIKFCDYSLESRSNVRHFESYRNVSIRWTVKERLRRYVEVPPVSPLELDSWSIRGIPLWTIAGIMLESNQTANETLFDLPHEQSRMLCMHQFKHTFDFERRICVLSRGPGGGPAQVLINPVLKGFSEEESAVIVKERSRVCEAPYLKSRRPVLDVQFTIDAPSENERHRPTVVRTIIDDPTEALAFQMRWQEMQGSYECK